MPHCSFLLASDGLSYPAPRRMRVCESEGFTLDASPFYCIIIPHILAVYLAVRPCRSFLLRLTLLPAKDSRLSELSRDIMHCSLLRQLALPPLPADGTIILLRRCLSIVATSSGAYFLTRVRAAFSFFTSAPHGFRRL